MKSHNGSVKIVAQVLIWSCLVFSASIEASSGDRHHRNPFIKTGTMIHTIGEIVNMDGVVQAHSIKKRNGEIILE